MKPQTSIKPNNSVAMHTDFLKFSAGKNCAVCKGNADVRSMIVHVNNQLCMAPICNKPECRGAARRNKVKNIIDPSVVQPMPESYVSTVGPSKMEIMVHSTKGKKLNRMNSVAPKTSTKNPKFNRK